MAPALWVLCAILVPALWAAFVTHILARLQRRRTAARGAPPSDYQI